MFYYRNEYIISHSYLDPIVYFIEIGEGHEETQLRIYGRSYRIAACTYLAQ